jgi:hypothetical protein
MSVMMMGSVLVGILESGTSRTRDALLALALAQGVPPWEQRA